MGVVTLLICKRDHGETYSMNFLQDSGRIKRCCTFILAYRQNEGIGSNALQCFELPKSKIIPKGWMKLA